MQPTWRTFVLFGMGGVILIVAIVLITHRSSNGGPDVSATATAFVAAQPKAGTGVAVVSSPTSQPPAQPQATPVQQVLIQCADSVIRATCPPVAPTQAPPNTAIPIAAASPPASPAATAVATFPPAQAQTSESEIDCTYPNPCTIPTPGANQAVLIHGAILGTDPLNCHYQVFPSGSAVRASYNGTYRVFTITGTQDQINAKIREHLNGLGSSCTSV